MKIKLIIKLIYFILMMKMMTLINKIDDWNFDERLSKEFESIGFFISDHPLNQYSDILENYKIYKF